MPRRTPSCAAILPVLLPMLASCGAARGATGIDVHVAPNRIGASSTKDPIEPQAPVASSAGRVAVGSSHACYLTDAGAPFCWGHNDANQLADGTDEDRSVPTAVVGLRRAKEIVAGGTGTCAITPANELFCWGRVGGRSLANPTRIDGLTNVRAVSIGSTHACAITGDGGARCWGSNGFGQLGNGTMLPTRGAELAVVGGLSDAVAIAVGPSLSCALRTTGDVMCWGTEHFDKKLTSPTPYRIDGLPRAKSVVACGMTMCALSSDGILYGWGSSQQPPARADIVPGWPRLSSITAGMSQKCGIEEGSLAVHCTGPAAAGGPAPSSFVSPLRVQGFRVSKSATIVAGGSETCVLDGGELSCMGANEYGQLGIGESAAMPEPRRIAGIEGVKSVIVFDAATCALKTDGHVSCWGLGGSAWASLTDFERRKDGHVPQDVAGISNAKALFRGPRWGQACVTEQDGSVRCFTAGKYAYPAATEQKGTEFLPRRVLGIKNVVSTARTSGGGSLAVLSNGTVIDLDVRPRSGASGTERVADAFVKPIPGLRNVKLVATSQRRACALHHDGTVDCWTAPGKAPFDRASTSTKPSVVRVAGVEGAVDLSSSFDELFAVTRDGSVLKWKIPGKYDDPVPAGLAAEKEPSLHGVTGLTHAYGTLLCFVRNGGIDCNRDGRGNGPRPPTTGLAPFHFDFDGPVSADAHSNVCAVSRGGLVTCWGKNLGGALGAPDRDRSSVPLSIILPR